MQAIGSSQLCKDVDAQALAVAVFKDENARDGLLKTLDKATGGFISRVRVQSSADKPDGRNRFAFSQKQERKVDCDRASCG